MSLGGVGFYSLTTTVAPGAGTKIGAHEIIIDGKKVYYQAVVAGFLSPGGIFCAVSEANPLPIYFVPAMGDAINLHSENAVATTEQVKISYTVPADKVLNLERITLACGFDGAARLKINGVTARVLRSGPGQQTVELPIDPLMAVEGDIVTVTHCGAVGTPPNALVSVALDARLKNA